jgi:hypothetical protein
MKYLKTILVLAVLLVLSAVVVSGVVYSQNYTLYQSGNSTFTYTDGIPVCQNNASNGLPAAPAYVDGAASGQSIIFSNGVPTTVILDDGYQIPYNTTMYDSIATAYNVGGPFGVNVSSNPNAPSGGTWTQVVESGTYGTQEPNLNSN